MQRIVPTVFHHNITEFDDRIKKLGFSRTLHIDFMDGVFVPDTSLEPELMPKVPKHLLRAHLMVKNPIRYLDALKKQGFVSATAHIEAFPDEDSVREFISACRRYDISPMLAKNPSTSVASLIPFIHEIRRVLLMGVQPGKEGQLFRQSVLDEIKLMRKEFPELIIEVDGGVTSVNARAIFAAGADILNVGSAISNHKNPETLWTQLMDLAAEETTRRLDGADALILKLLANTVREDILTMVHNALSGHSGGSLGMADVFSCLYGWVLRHNPRKPNWDDRDFVFLSNGHICPVLYACLAEMRYFPKNELLTFRKLDSRLQGHPHNGALPGVENSGGPLGQGISQAIGAALALRLDGKPNRVFCFLGDGEMNEGQVWEALLLAGKERVPITFIIDRNNMQIDGNADDVMPLEPLAEKLRSFNIAVVELDGHNIPEIVHTLSQPISIPTAIIAYTTPGKGVSFMEHDYHWHGKAPNDEQLQTALAEIHTERKRLEEWL